LNTVFYPCLRGKSIDQVVRGERVWRDVKKQKPAKEFSAVNSVSGSIAKARTKLELVNPLETNRCNNLLGNVKLELCNIQQPTCIIN
jgi:hypothetical protein